MKNQYVGDISDFHKYSLLRALSGDGKIRTGVCWMLTPNDTRNDGQFIDYLDAPQTWRAYAPEIFDGLAACVREPSGRNVERIEAAGILPNTLFYSAVLSDAATERRLYFEEMQSQFRNTDLVFFDPDNGLEIKSRPIGRTNSNKFLYWPELVNTYVAGHSVLVYQHFIREQRDQFIGRIAAEVLKRTGASEVLTFRTSKVSFFLASQPKHMEHFERQAAQIAQIWEKHIQIGRHQAAA